MKRRVVVIFLLITMFSRAFAQQDVEGSKDHPMFPNRMPNYFITESGNSFDEVDFNLAGGGEKMISKEGSKSWIRYDFNFESGQSKPSGLQILRNYEAAVKKIGGTTVFLSADDAVAVFKLIKSGSEVWVKVESGGSDNNEFYELTVLEVEEMKQEITANDMLTALNTEGRMVLYINFETGKAVIQSESQAIIEQLIELLKSNPDIRIHIEGHTDNTGSEQANQVLSEKRSLAVFNAINSRGIDKIRLSSQGWGQSKPIADNTTEQGKAKNRRVEIVKM